MKKKIIWMVLLVTGVLTFVIPLVTGIYDSLNGFGGLCFGACDLIYGYKAFIESIYLYSFIFWPTYIVGVILIVLSTIKLKTKKKEK